MSKKSEKVKDFLYDSTDYVLIIAIVLVVLAIIAWRLDVLFAKNTNTSKSNQPVAEENIEKEVKSEKAAEEAAAPEAESVAFEIPEGSLPPTVANILVEAGLIEDTVAFLQKSRDMGLEDKFAPGAYEVKKDILDQELIETISVE